MINKKVSDFYGRNHGTTFIGLTYKNEIRKLRESNVDLIDFKQSFRQWLVLSRFERKWKKNKYDVR